MLSSVFLYNSVGHIDEAAISTLGLMTRVTSSVKQTLSEADGSSVADMMPTFFWLLRDFSLRLEDAHGNTISKDEYLEQSLQPSGNEDRAATREAIRECFSKRHLATLPRPAKDEANATNLNARPWLISPWLSASTRASCPTVAFLACSFATISARPLTRGSPNG